MTALPYFLKQDGDKIIFNSTGEMVFFIKESYFEREFAVLNVDIVTLMGIFNYALFDNGKPVSKLQQFNFPTRFSCKPSSIEVSKDLKLTKNSPPEDYRLLKFVKGDECVVNVKTPQDVSNIEDMIRMQIGAVLPNSIPYDKLHENIIDNIALNGSSYFVHASLIGITISELNRSISDRSIPFRLSGSKDMTAYQPVNIKDISKYVSPFTAITGENWDESVSNALVNKNPKYSPLENLFVR